VKSRLEVVLGNHAFHKTSLKTVLLTPLSVVYNELANHQDDCSLRKGYYSSSLIGRNRSLSSLVIKVSQGSDVAIDLINFLKNEKIEAVNWIWFGYAGGLLGNAEIGTVTTSKSVISENDTVGLETKQVHSFCSVKICSVSRFLSISPKYLRSLKEVNAIDAVDLETYYFHRELLKVKNVFSINVISDLPLTYPFNKVASDKLVLNKIQEGIAKGWLGIEALL